MTTRQEGTVKVGIRKNGVRWGILEAARQWPGSAKFGGKGEGSRRPEGSSHN